MGHFASAKRLLTYSKRYYAVLSLGMVASIVGSGLDAWLAWLIKPLVDNIIINEFYAWWVAYIPLFVVLISFIRALARFMSDYYLALASRGVLANLRVDLFKKMMCLPISFYDKNPTAELLTYHTMHVQRLSRIITDNAFNFIRDFTMTVALTVVMFAISWQLSMMFFVVAPLSVWCVRVFGKRIRFQQENLQDNNKWLLQFMQERLRMQRIIKMHLNAPVLITEYQGIVDKLKGIQIKQVKSKSANAALGQWIMSIPVALAIALLIFMRSIVTLGSFTAVLLAIGRLRAPVSSLVNTAGVVYEGLGIMDDLNKVLDEPNEVDTGERVLEKVQGSIAFNDVCFGYPGADKKVFEKFSLKINTGEIVALVGVSGSGKTTLTQLLARFYPVDAGTITLDGHDINTLTLHSLRSQLSLVSQDVLLLNDTVVRNICMGANVPFSEVEKAARRSQAHDFIMELPDGYQTQLGENGQMLSGGQRQRIALARTLLQDAPIIIFDEATSSLDAVSESAIQEVIYSLSPQKTILIISHRLPSLQRASRLVVMEKGKILGEGSHEDLLASNAHYQSLYHAYEDPQD